MKNNDIKDNYKRMLNAIKQMMLSYQNKKVSKDNMIIQIVSMCDCFLKNMEIEEQKIYCIFECDYLPNCHAVFDNETQAKQHKRIIDNFNGFDSVFIEEYEVNKVYQPITAKRIKFWKAVMWIKENKLHKKGEIEIFEGEDVVPLNFNLEFKKNIEKYYIEVTSYKSKKHAMEKVKEHPTESEGVDKKESEER